MVEMLQEINSSSPQCSSFKVFLPTNPSFFLTHVFSFLFLFSFSPEKPSILSNPQNPKNPKSPPFPLSLSPSLKPIPIPFFKVKKPFPTLFQLLPPANPSPLHPSS